MTITTQATRLPFSRPHISEAAIEAVGEVLRSGWITSGPKTIEFETQFAAYCGAKHAIAVTSATAGLDIMVGLLDLIMGEDGACEGCVPVAETCNGKDDDCDGIIDNRLVDVGRRRKSNRCHGLAPSGICDRRSSNPGGFLPLT